MAEYLPDTQVFESPKVETPGSSQQKSVFDAPSMPRPSVGGYKPPKFGGDPGFGMKKGGVNQTLKPTGKVKPRPLLPAATPQSGRSYQSSNVLPDRGYNPARRPMINPSQQPTI